MNKGGLGAGDGGDLGQGTKRRFLEAGNGFLTVRVQHFGRGPRIAYRTTNQPAGLAGGFSNSDGVVHSHV